MDVQSETPDDQPVLQQERVQSPQKIPQPVGTEESTETEEQYVIHN